MNNSFEDEFETEIKIDNNIYFVSYSSQSKSLGTIFTNKNDNIKYKNIIDGLFSFDIIDDIH